jgi:hypothetical protein
MLPLNLASKRIRASLLCIEARSQNKMSTTTYFVLFVPPCR